MSDLKRESTALVRAGREALRPTDADRMRILEGLKEKLGDAVALGTSSASSAAVGGLARISTTTASLLAGVGAALLGGAFLLSGHHTLPHAAQVAASAAPQITESKLEDTTATNPSVAPSSGLKESIFRNSEASPATVRARSKVGVGTESRPTSSRAAAGDGLSEEVAILMRAEAELHGGRPANALTLLDEHERRFAKGTLAQERTAARIQALCSLGRTVEADAQLARLSRISPQSPLVAHARHACRTRGANQP